MANIQCTVTAYLYKKNPSSTPPKSCIYVTWIQICSFVMFCTWEIIEIKKKKWKGEKKNEWVWVVLQAWVLSHCIVHGEETCCFTYLLCCVYTFLFPWTLYRHLFLCCRCLSSYSCVVRSPFPSPFLFFLFFFCEQHQVLHSPFLMGLCKSYECNVFLFFKCILLSFKLLILLCVQLPVDFV